MGSITLEQIGVALALIVGIVGSVKYIAKDVNKFLEHKIDDITDNLQEQIATLTETVNKLDEGQCKNYLVRFLKDKENGVPLDPVEEERAYEIYDRYTNVLHKNSYIHDKWNKLMK